MRKRNSIIKAARYTCGLFLVLITGLAPFGLSSPSIANAQTNPIDLVLGGNETAPWNVVNLMPGNSGTTTVELHNAGTSDGFVTIWISDILSGEGINPEPETGDKSEPGELDKYLIFNLSANGLTSNLNLPVTFDSLPKSLTDSNYIDITPIKAGQTINLEWKWELPVQTGNDVQGDMLTFTINYLLRECIITNVSSVVTPAGTFTANVTASSETSKGKLAISTGTTGKTAANQTLTDIWIIEIDKDPLPTAADKKNVSTDYEAGPEGATFDQPINITLSYNPDNIPGGIGEDELFIAYWDKVSGQWIPLSTYSINTEENTITARTTHFSRYAVQSPRPAPPPTGEGEEIEVPPGGGGTPTTGAQIEVDILDNVSTVETRNDGTLKETLTLSDLDKNFNIDVNAGGRVTGPDGVTLNHIDLITTDRPIPLPDNIVMLSPVYELTGYTAEMEAVPVVFLPPARLTINYDPQKLPENSFAPFIASYSEEGGITRLNLPPSYIIETGKVHALISNESVLFVAVELAPPPPPLPATFEASNLVINPRQTFVGETVSISITIANKGETEGTYELHLVVDGIVRAIEDVTLSAGGTETLTFEVSNLSAGSHTAKIADLTGEFTVERMEITVIESRFNWLLLDTIVGSFLAVGAIVLFFVIRRSRRARLAIEDVEDLKFRDE